MDLMTEAIRSLTALHALLARHVWDDESDPETVYIQGHGLTTPQVEAIIEEWFEMTDPGMGAVVERWTEDEPFDQADGQKVYVTRVTVSFAS